MKLLFIRHGEPDYEHDSLTPEGFREAEYLAARLSQLDIAEIYVSPKGRAKATAAPTAEKTGKTPIELNWLKEFTIPVKRPDKNGEVINIPWDWLPQDLAQSPALLDPVKWRENSVFVEAGVGEAYDRIVSEFDSLIASHGYVRDGMIYRVESANTDTLVFFCHLGLACLLMSHLMNCSPMVLWQGTCLAPSSVTTMCTEERRPGIAVIRALSIGDTSHLYKNDVEPSFAGRFCEIYGNGDRID